MHYKTTWTNVANKNIGLTNEKKRNFITAVIHEPPLVLGIRNHHRNKGENFDLLTNTA